MLWMKTMPAERWMAATGAAVVALALLGMFHLAVGGGAEAVDQRRGWGTIGFGVTWALAAPSATPAPGSCSILLLVVGLLLYFNMTVGDLVAAWLAARAEDRDELSRAEARQRGTPSADEPMPVAPAETAGRVGLIDRVRTAFGGGEEDEEPPLIVRRERAGGQRRRPTAIAHAAAIAIAPVPILPGTRGARAATGVAAVSVEALESEESAPGRGGGRERSMPRSRPVERVWDLPEIELLSDAPASSAAQMDLTAKGQRIRETLAHFGIGVKVARIQEGPVVTQYALDVEPGIKLSRIEGLADNLALGLAARSIRIEAPIPGEPYVGIEIPNSAFDLVTLKEVLGSAELRRRMGVTQQARLRPRPGRGRPAVQRRPGQDAAPADRRRHRIGQERLRQRDHLLAADARHPDRGEADPDRPQARRDGAVQGHPAPADRGDRRHRQGGQRPEVDGRHHGGRYHEFAQRGVRNIAGYNEALRTGRAADAVHRDRHRRAGRPDDGQRLRGGGHHHPHRAAGAGHRDPPGGRHPATIGAGHHRPDQGQHPEPHRLRHDLAAWTSRTILDTTGAEDLLGRGDMLYQPIDAPRAVRLQGVLVTDREIDDVARHWRGQGGPQYRPEITAPKRDGKAGGRPGDDEDDDADALLSQAVDIVRRSDKASASLLQRRLRIGYARAARILDQMEDRGIVGPADGSRFREVLVTPRWLGRRDRSRTRAMRDRRRPEQARRGAAHRA